MAQAELDDLKKAEPYLRTALAFIYFITRGEEGGVSIHPDCYIQADEFLRQLRADVSAQQD